MEITTIWGEGNSCQLYGIAVSTFPNNQEITRIERPMNSAGKARKCGRL